MPYMFTNCEVTSGPCQAARGRGRGGRLAALAADIATIGGAVRAGGRCTMRVFAERAASSVVEHLTFNQGVPGSIPGRPKTSDARSIGDFAIFDY